MCTKSKISSSAILLTFLSLWWAVGLTAVNQDAGTTGFNTLKLVYSAHANAMGQAMTGVVTNVDGMQFNPASIIRLPEKELNTAEAEIRGAVRYESVGSV